MDEVKVRAESAISPEIAEYIDDNLTAFEQVIAKAMALQLIYGWDVKQSVREALRGLVA